MSSLSPDGTLGIELPWAHCVGDDSCVMIQKDEFEYYSIRNCPTREEEGRTPQLTNNSVREDSGGSLKATYDKASMHAMFVGTDPLDVEDAFARRGVALLVAGVMSYDTHGETRRTLMWTWSTAVKADHLIGLYLADIGMCDGAI